MAVLDIVSTVTAAPAVPAELQSQWFNGLSLAAAGKISARWNAIVGTAPLWLANVATPSNANFKPFVNPAYQSKRDRNADIITGIQLKKLTASQAKAKANFDEQFANAGAKYITAVNDKAGNWTAGMPNTLALTGDRFEGRRGPASVHVRGIASDSTMLRDIGTNSNYTGTIDPLTLAPQEFRYVKQGFASMVRASLEGKLIQIGVFIMAGYIVDVTGYNALLTEALRAFLRPNYQGGSLIEFTIAGGGFVLHTHLEGDDPV